jgi:hypothetical protein
MKGILQAVEELTMSSEWRQIVQEAIAPPEL